MMYMKTKELDWKRPKGSKILASKTPKELE